MTCAYGTGDCPPPSTTATTAPATSPSTLPNTGVAGGSGLFTAGDAVALLLAGGLLLAATRRRGRNIAANIARRW